MKEKKFYSLMNDTTLKYLLKNKKTRSYIYELIDLKIKDGAKHLERKDKNEYHLLERELPKNNDYSNYVFDNLIADEDEKVIINLITQKKYQLNEDIYTKEENFDLYYEAITNEVNKITKENKEREIIVIVLCDYDLSHHLDFIKDLEEIKSKGIIRCRCMSFSPRPNLTVIYSNIYDEAIALYDKGMGKLFGLFMCKNYDTIRKISGDDKEMNIIIDELEKLNDNKEFNDLYNIEEQTKLKNKSTK